jgi:UDP-glucose 4-epimerase
VLELLRERYNVVVIDNFVNSSRACVERVKNLAGRDFTFYEGDVRDKALLAKIFTTHNIDCVIHFAGLKAVGESISIPLSYYDNNLNSTLALCQAMNKYGVKRIIFSSSATVYSGDNEMPLRETSKTGDCSCPYGWTKYMCEQILRDASFANKDWSVVLLRYFNPLGADKSGDIGEDPSGIPNNLVPYIAQAAIGRREFLPLYGGDYPTPDGTCIRDYIHVADLASGHMAAIRYCESHTGAKEFNLGTGKGTSVLEMISSFENATGVKINYKIMDRRPGDLPVSYADPSLAKKELGWSAQKSIINMCADTWRWQKQNPHGFN